MFDRISKEKHNELAEIYKNSGTPLKSYEDIIDQKLINTQKRKDYLIHFVPTVMIPCINTFIILVGIFKLLF